MSETQTKPKVGLSDLNTDLSAPRHKDLYEGAKGENAGDLKKQARTLGFAFFVFFGLIITGLSFSFNHAWKPGRGANVRALTEETIPGWAERPEGAAPDAKPIENHAVGTWRAQPPRLATLRGEQGTPASKLDFAFTDADDVTPAAGEMPFRVYVDGKLVVTAYFPAEAVKAMTDAEAKAAAPAATPPAAPAEKGAAWIRLPNREPAPARPSFVHAYREAKLLRMLPTRYVLYVGCVFGVLALLVPFVLVPFYTFWMQYVTAPLGWFNTRVILTVVWFLLFTPMGLVRKLLGKDALRRAKLPEGESYWIERKERAHTHFKSGF